MEICRSQVILPPEQSVFGPESVATANATKRTKAVKEEGIDAHTSELVDADEKNVPSKQDYIDTEASLSVEELLLLLQEKCSTTDSEWERCSKKRVSEMEACSKSFVIFGC